MGCSWVFAPEPLEAGDAESVYEHRGGRQLGASPGAAAGHPEFAQVRRRVVG